MNRDGFDFRFAQECFGDIGDEDYFSDATDINAVLLGAGDDLSDRDTNLVTKILPLFHLPTQQIEIEINTSIPLVSSNVKKMFGSPIYCRWLVLETNVNSGENVVGTARVIFGNSEICQSRIAVIDVLCGLPPIDSSLLIIRTLLEKIECFSTSMGISSLLVLAPILQLRENSIPEMDFENSRLIKLLLKCGFQETGGETAVGHLLGNESSLESVSMILQYKKNLLDEIKMITPPTDVVSLNGTSIPTEVTDEMLPEPSMQNLMESLFTCLQKEYGEN